MFANMVSAEAREMGRAGSLDTAPAGHHRDPALALLVFRAVRYLQKVETLSRGFQWMQQAGATAKFMPQEARSWGTSWCVSRLHVK